MSKKQISLKSSNEKKNEIRKINKNQKMHMKRYSRRRYWQLEIHLRYITIQYPMKLTPQVISEAPTYRSPIGESILSLRSLDAPLIENFGVAGDSFEAIDLTDNDIKTLGNFPPLPKLKTLYIAKNKLNSISPQFPASVHNLKTLSLINNNLSRLSDIEPLHHCQNLQNLYLSGNRITEHKYYRLWIIWRIPTLKVLDFGKVKEKERLEAQESFGSLESPTKLAIDLLSVNKIDEEMNEEGEYDTEGGVVEDNSKLDRQVNETIKRLTDDEMAKLREELASASTLAEIERIETLLQNGYV